MYLHETASEFRRRRGIESLKQGLPATLIAKVLGTTPRTLYRWSDQAASGAQRLATDRSLPAPLNGGAACRAGAVAAERGGISRLAERAMDSETGRRTHRTTFSRTVLCEQRVEDPDEANGLEPTAASPTGEQAGRPGHSAVGSRKVPTHSSPCLGEKSMAWLHR